MTDNTVAKVMTGQNANRAITERRATTEKDKVNQVQATLIKLYLSGTVCSQSVYLPYSSTASCFPNNCWGFEAFFL